MKTRVFPRLLWIRLMQIWRWMGEIGLFRIISYGVLLCRLAFCSCGKRWAVNLITGGYFPYRLFCFYCFTGKEKIFCFYINRFHGPSGFISGNIVSIHALSSAACFFMKSILLCCVIYWFYWVLLLFRHCQQRFVHTLFFFVLCRLLVLNGVAVSGRMCCHFGCVFF